MLRLAAHGRTGEAFEPLDEALMLGLTDAFWEGDAGFCLVSEFHKTWSGTLQHAQIPISASQNVSAKEANLFPKALLERGDVARDLGLRPDSGSDAVRGVEVVDRVSSRYGLSNQVCFVSVRRVASKEGQDKAAQQSFVGLLRSKSLGLLSLLRWKKGHCRTWIAI